MKLKDFVKQTLLDITDGIEEARKKSSIPIAPTIINGVNVTPAPQNVSFEIAVTLSKEGGAGIDVLPLGLKGKISSEHVNRISFQVPLYFTLQWNRDEGDT
jgi:hypothetical protein